MTHNLLRAAATLTGRAHALARGATLRRQLTSRARTTGQTATTTRAAVAHALAPRPTMAEPVEQHLPPHTRPTGHHLTLSDTPHSPTKTGEAGQTSRSTMPSAG
jgi:hypothetical protein